MLFLGTTFFGAKYTIDPSPLLAKDLFDITLRDGVYDQLFISKNPDIELEEGYDTWDRNSSLKADFNNSLEAGNSLFSLSNTDYIIIKCREVGTFDWTPIYLKQIKKVNDFKINFNDYYRASNKSYEYSVTSVCNGIENSYISSEVRSEFDGLFICDKDNIYGTLYNLDTIDTTRNMETSTLNLLNSSYANIVSNSKINYDSGTASGVFIKFDQEHNTIDIPAGIEYRGNLKNWLNNKNPKILKFHDGRIWLIGITGNLTDSADNVNNIRKISFDWVEIGKIDSETLYNSNLSDIGKEWWY